MPVYPNKPKNSGQALVEFALILIVLLLLVTFIIEVGRIGWAWAAVQNSAREGARYAITGRAEPNICDGEPAGCLARTESVHQVALTGLTGWRIREDVAFQDDNFTLVQVFGMNSSLPAGQQLQEGFAGEPGQSVVVRVTYNVPVITPLLRPIVENVPVFGQVTLQNELFGQTGGRTEGAALPPPLPVLPKLGPTDTPTPTFTPSPVPSIPIDATPIPAEECAVKIQGTLIEGQRIIEITGDRYRGNDVNNGTYTVDVVDVTNGVDIARDVPVLKLPTNFVGSHGCTNGNEGYIELDLASTQSYYINPAYAGGLPVNILVLVDHQNTLDDDSELVQPLTINATQAAPTFTPLPTLSPTPDFTPTPFPAGAFVTFPDGGNCVTPNPGARFSLFGANWPANHTLQFVWNNNEVIGSAATDAAGFLTTIDFDIGPRAPGTYTLRAVDVTTASGASFSKSILIPCPVPTPTITPTPTPTLSPPDLVISAPEIRSSFPITEFTPVEFTFSITNTGETDINSLFFVDLFLDPPAVAFGSETNPVPRTFIIADPYSDGFVAVPDLPANSSRDITIVSPLGFQNDATGPRVAWGMVDSINQVPDEEREDNNLSSAGGIPVVPAVVIPTATPLPGEVSEPNSIVGIVNAYYTEFVPQMRATVFLVEQPPGVGQEGTVVAQTFSDANGRYAFYEVPGLTGGSSYTVVSCLSLAGSGAFTGIKPSIQPDTTEAVIRDLYMIINATGCSI